MFYSLLCTIIVGMLTRILNRSRENQVSPTSCLTDRRTDIWNYGVASLLITGLQKLKCFLPVLNMSCNVAVGNKHVVQDLPGLEFGRLSGHKVAILPAANQRSLQVRVQEYRSSEFRIKYEYIDGWINNR